MARTSSIEFAQYVDPSYKINPFYEDLNHHLDLVLSGEIKRLMVFAPPQHGKSRTISETFPARWLGTYPDLPVAIVSYVAVPAQKFSTSVRDIVEGAEFARLYGELSHNGLPMTTRDDSRAKNFWRLNQPYRGGLWAGGIGGPVTSHGFGLIIIDDPFKGWAESQSLTIRQGVYDYYRHTLMTRLWEDGRIILVMTRWNQDDLAGRLMSEEPNEWVVIRYPAIAETQKERDLNNAYLGLPIGQPDPLGREPGEPLSPLRFSIVGLREKETQVGARGWSTEYQGVPRPAEGDRFKRSWFKTVEKVPVIGQRVRYWDKAGTEGGQGAFTCGLLMCHADGKYYIEDVVRGRWSAGEREAIIRNTIVADAQKYGLTGVRTYIEQEPGSGGKESAEYTIRNNAGFVIQADRPSGDKDTRMEPFAVQAEALNVVLVVAHWNSAWLEEITAIPNSKYRDQGDAASGAFNKLTLRDGGASVGKMTGLYPSRRKGR